MVSSGFSGPKTYDRLQIPNLSVDKRRTGNTEVLDSLRLEEKLRSHTLKYNFNFQRPSNAHGRLSVVPDIVAVPNVPHHDARTGGAPAGAPGTRARTRGPQGRTGHSASAARPARRSASGAAPGGVRGSDSRNTGRPQAKTVMDFRGSGSGGIHAPRLKDSMEQLGLPAKQKQGAKTAGTAAKQDKPAGAHAVRSSSDFNKMKAKKPKAATVPQKPDPKTIKKQEALRGLDQSETTVVGFDISRSVFEKPTREQRKAEEPVGTRLQGGFRRIRSALSWILVIVATFFLLSYSLTVRASISDVTRQNAELERSIAELTEDVSKAQMQVALQDDLNNIKIRAAALGLVQPEEDQIQYVDLGAPDASEDEQMHEAAYGGSTLS